MSLEDMTMPNTELIQAVRSLSRAAALSDLNEEDTQEIVALLKKVEGKLPAERERIAKQPFDAPGLLSEAGKVWLAGQFNTRVPQLPLTFSGKTASGFWTSSELDEGPPDSVHGGISAFLLDVVSGGLMQQLGLRAVTGNLNIRYSKRVPLLATVELRSELVEVQRRKHIVKGEIVLDGETLVSSEGLFITI